MNGKEFTTTRRRALKIISAAIVALIVYLTARFTRFFVRQKRTLTVVLKDERQNIQLEPQVAIVREQGKWNVLSRTCPHLGCTIKYDAQSQTFVCPCHGSRFTRNGRFIKGPAGKNLTPLPFRQQGNRLTVTL